MRDCTYTKEADLCADFIKSIPNGWTAYPETCGWDILLSHDATGVQIGVEAKLSLNREVVEQAIRSARHWDFGGPDFRAVLIPYGREAWKEICDALGVTVIRFRREPNYRGDIRVHSYPSLPDPENWKPSAWGDDWYPWFPSRRETLPEYVPDVPAGVPAPTTLSKWKIQALKLLVILEERPVTRKDMKALGLSATRWTEARYGWLAPTDGGYGRSTRTPDFAASHPSTYEQIRSEKAAWMAKAGLE